MNKAVTNICTYIYICYTFIYVTIARIKIMLFSLKTCTGPHGFALFFM